MRRTIIILFGILIIFIVTFGIETLVNYYDNIKIRGIYALGIIVGVVLNSLFQEIIFWSKNNKSKK